MPRPAWPVRHQIDGALQFRQEARRRTPKPASEPENTGRGAIRRAMGAKFVEIFMCKDVLMALGHLRVRLELRHVGTHDRGSG